MDWIYYLTKFARMLFWAEVMLFLLFSLAQLTTGDLPTMIYTVPLAAIFLYAPAITTFMTTVGVRDREFEEERKALRERKRRENHRNVDVRSRGKRRR